MPQPHYIGIDISSGSSIRMVRAAAKIMPGMVVAMKEDGCVPHCKKDGYCIDAVAFENYQTRVGIDVPYQEGEDVLIRYLKNGDIFLGILENEVGNISYGDFLSSKGDGALKKCNKDENENVKGIMIGKSLDTINTEDYAPGTIIRIKVQVY